MKLGVKMVKPKLEKKALKLVDGRTSKKVLMEQVSLPKLNKKKRKLDKYEASQV